MKPYAYISSVLVASCMCGGHQRLLAESARPDPFLVIVTRYADTMLDRGRDEFGPVHTGLFLSALDRQTLQPLTTCPAPPAGVRDIDRVGQEHGPLVGSNPFHDQNLYRILYALTDITGQPRYRDAADQALRWFFTHAPWPQTGLLPWGEHMNWQVVTDQRASRCRVPHHELGRPWMLWDRCFSLAPQPSASFATALWEHQIADHQTGAFDRHAAPHMHKPGSDYDLPRHAGMYIQCWAKAYQHTRDEKYLHAIDVLLRRFEGKRDPRTGLVIAWGDDDVAWPLSSMSMAIECQASAEFVSPPLADRLRAFAAAEDKAFLALEHDPAGRGYVVSAVRQTGQPVTDIGEHHLQERTVMWGGKGGEATTAMVSLICAARHEQVPSDAYRKLILDAARTYLDQKPATDHDTWPLPWAQAITLQLVAHRLTGDLRHLQWARQLGSDAVRLYWQDNPLPKASIKTDHYETLTGADSLALALLDLATVDTPDATHVPSNTIDR